MRPGQVERALELLAGSAWFRADAVAEALVQATTELAGPGWPRRLQGRRDLH